MEVKVFDRVYNVVYGAPFGEKYLL